MEQSKDVWKDRTFLVMRKDALLPNRCIKTNSPADGKRITLKLRWLHPIRVFIFVLAMSFLIYLHLPPLLHTILSLPIIAACFIPKKIKVEVGISEGIRKKRSRAIKTSRIFFATGLVSIITGIVLFDQQPMGAVIIFSGLLLIAIGALCRADGASPIALKRAKGDYIWLSRVNDDYLSALPDWSQIPKA